MSIKNKIIIILLSVCIFACASHSSRCEAYGGFMPSYKQQVKIPKKKLYK